MTRRLDGVPPRFVYRLVMFVRGLLLRLVRRMVPARVAMFEQFTGVWHTQMLYAAACLRIADHLDGEPRTAGELATATGAQPDTVARLMRALVSTGVFAR